MSLIEDDRPQLKHEQASEPLNNLRSLATEIERIANTPISTTVEDECLADVDLINLLAYFIPRYLLGFIVAHRVVRLFGSRAP